MYSHVKQIYVRATRPSCQTVKSASSSCSQIGYFILSEVLPATMRVYSPTCGPNSARKMYFSLSVASSSLFVIIIIKSWDRGCQHLFQVLFRILLVSILLSGAGQHFTFWRWSAFYFLALVNCKPSTCGMRWRSVTFCHRLMPWECDFLKTVCRLNEAIFNLEASTLRTVNNNLVRAVNKN